MLSCTIISQFFGFSFFSLVLIIVIFFFVSFSDLRPLVTVCFWIFFHNSIFYLNFYIFISVLERLRLELFYHLACQFSGANHSSYHIHII